MRAPKYRKYHFTYKTTCKLTGKYYVGMHSTDNINDAYLGSGLRIRRSIAKHGRDAHVREILEHFPNRKALIDREKEIITPEMLADALCMNLMPGGGALDRPVPTEQTRLHIAEGGTKRWALEKEIRKQRNAEQPFTMTRDEVLAELITSSDQLNKNATRAMEKVKLVTEMPSRTREANVIKRWRCIIEAIEQPEFIDRSFVEQINAYVHDIKIRPTCKICSADVTFFRFGQPYAIYCGARCQLLDPAQKNPVASRWTHKYSTILA